MPTSLVAEKLPMEAVEETITTQAQVAVETVLQAELAAKMMNRCFLAREAKVLPE